MKTNKIKSVQAPQKYSDIVSQSLYQQSYFKLTKDYNEEEENADADEQESISPQKTFVNLDLVDIYMENVS